MFSSFVEVNSVNAFKARRDEFWLYQKVAFDFHADLTGTGHRSEQSQSDIVRTGGGTYSADTAIAVPLLKVVRLIM